MPFIIAHGALGPWDEIIYLSIGVVFVGFMVVSWFRSRNQPPDEEEAQAADPALTEQSPDHFRLD